MRSVIDIGSNTFLLLVAEDDLSKVYRDEERFVGLGEGVSLNGYISHESFERARRVLEEYKEISESLGSDGVYPFATEAVRKAKNRRRFEELVEEVLGTPLEVISPKEEAILGFISCIPDAQGPLATVDVGGGSTEVVKGSGEKISYAESFPVGSVYLAKRFVKSDPPAARELKAAKDYIMDVFSGLPRLERVLFGLGGTVTTLAMLIQGLKDFDPDVIHLCRVGFDELERLVHRLNSSTRSERLSMGVPEGRVDFIGMGGLIVLAVMELSAIDEMVVSVKGVRYGYFMKVSGAFHLPLYSSQL